MSSVITHVDKNSPASLKNIKAGDRLIRINGHKIADVLDYKFHAYEPDLLLELHSEAGKIRLLRLRKPAGADLGLTFGDYLMDRPRACANKCVFCFVDQLPRGLRKTLYFKDDDVRLSFLCGNYVTLTNLSESEIHRIVALRVSPLNISVHSTDPGCAGCCSAPAGATGPWRLCAALRKPASVSTARLYAARGSTTARSCRAR
jgi:NifB/MoaA-like Fe-S oxidoreductase